jgi:hypothetical protein
MKASEAKKLVGKKVSVRRRYSGITQTGIVLGVRGRNVEIDIMGMKDWLWLPDLVITPVSFSDHP